MNDSEETKRHIKLYEGGKYTKIQPLLLSSNYYGIQNLMSQISLKINQNKYKILNNNKRSFKILKLPEKKNKYETRYSKQTKYFFI